MTWSVVMFLAVFIPVWLAVMGSYLFFYGHVAPAALGRWAGEEGYRILRRRNANPIEWFSLARGSGDVIYRVWLQDKPKAELECLVRVGTGFWFSLSVRGCPVQVVRWEAGKEPLPPPPPSDAMWDRELD
ncbi:hypothetical protein AB1L88_14665 [Tautonia sp. JC769]|uniref:hypothetical protein n=1 Tax=Tautonia sp. JC769 TaxID=3232135 RepID=UPI00345AA3A8